MIGLKHVSNEKFLASKPHLTLNDRVFLANKKAKLDGKKENITRYHLMKHYKKMKIKKKVFNVYDYAIWKNDPEE